MKLKRVTNIVWISLILFVFNSDGNIRKLSTSTSHPHPRDLTSKHTKINYYKCSNTNTTITCRCDKSCLVHVTNNVNDNDDNDNDNTGDDNNSGKNNTRCVIKKCWNVEKNQCVNTGTHFVTPLILNIIPLTQLIGLGHVVIQRWDLFGLQLGVTFGPLIVFCCYVFGTIAYDFRPKDTNRNELEEGNYLDIDMCSNTYSCCHSILVIVFWVMSIVQTSSPNQILDGNGCYLSGF